MSVHQHFVSQHRVTAVNYDGINFRPCAMNVVILWAAFIRVYRMAEVVDWLDLVHTLGDVVVSRARCWRLI